MTWKHSHFMLVFPRNFSFLPNFHACFYLTIRQRGRVVYEQIVDEGETRVDYLLIDNEAELSNCFSINHHIKYKLGCINKILNKN